MITALLVFYVSSLIWIYRHRPSTLGVKWTTIIIGTTIMIIAAPFLLAKNIFMMTFIDE